MKQELLKQESTELTNKDFGAADGITSEDILIPRLAVMQSISEMVKNEQAKAGDIVNCMMNEVICPRGSMLDFIPIVSFKFWIIKRDGDFESIVPAVSDQELAWKEDNIERIFNHAFYVLLLKDIESGSAFPMQLTFRSTERQTAKILSTLLIHLKRAELASWDKYFSLGTYLKTKDKYSWYATAVKVGGDSSEKAKSEAKYWQGIIKRLDIKSNLEGDIKNEDNANGGVIY